MGPQKPGDQGDAIVSGGPAMGPSGDPMAPPPGMMDKAVAWEDSDGSLIVDLSPPEDPAGDPSVHDANLAEHIDDASLARLAGDLKPQIEADKTSRTEWEQGYVEGMTLLGLRVTDRTFPFKGACGVFDSTMLDATIRIQATFVGEFLPNEGPVKTQVVGDEDEEISARADRVKAWMNYYLTKGAPEYYPDRDQMLFWLPVVGSMFTKTYNDPILGRPTQPYITPDKLVVNYAATSLTTATRISHLIDMSKRDVMNLFRSALDSLSGSVLTVISFFSTIMPMRRAWLSFALLALVRSPPSRALSKMVSKSSISVSRVRRTAFFAGATVRRKATASLIRSSSSSRSTCTSRV
jgi:hypothetical protein